MNLKNLLNNRHEWSDDETIYVIEPWSGDAEALLSNESPDFLTPITLGNKSYAYFLEGFIARDFLDALGVTGDVHQAACERLIQYAENDA